MRLASKGSIRGRGGHPSSLIPHPFWRAVIGAALALLGSAAPVLAQEYPVRPIRIIVPFVPGGATDILGRLLAARFHAAWGQAATVENRAGAGGTIGAEIVAKAPPDGYTLLMTSASIAVNVTLYPKTAYDARKDLVPIVHVASAPLVLVVHPSVPARTLKELLAVSKSRKDGLNFGTNGSGTTSHLGAVMLQQMAGLNLTHIHYKGAGASMIAATSGETDMGMPAVTSGRPHIIAGRLRGLAITTKRPSSVLPDLPTIDSIYRGFDIDNWFALFAPAGTPQAIITKAHAEAVKGLQHPDMKTWISREGAEPVGNSTAEFAAFFRSEIEKYAKIVKASGAKPDA
jgi:tripartite-type tricarboxylate transporter receptor subunit TctC